MPYPNDSNFAATGQTPAYWIVEGPQGSVLCQTNGLGFVLALQRRLATEGVGATFDGNRLSGDAVNPDGVWGPITSRVLWLALSHASAPPELLQLVAHEAGWRGRGVPRQNARLGRGSVLAGLWILHRAAIGDAPLAPTAIRLPAVVEPPVWLARPPSPMAPLVCARLAAGEGPAAAPPPVVPREAPPPVAPPTPDAALPREDLRPGATLPPGTVLEPVRGSSVSYGLIAASLLGVGIIWYGTTQLQRQRATVDRARRTRQLAGAGEAY